jgi:hypothetical protein
MNASVCSLPRRATVSQAVIPAAKLAGFGGPQPNARPVDLQRVAVDDACLTRKILGNRCAGRERPPPLVFEAPSVMSSAFGRTPTETPKDQRG